MLLKEFLELNRNGGLLGFFLTGTDGWDYFYKRDIPEAFENYKVLYWRVDVYQEDLSVAVDGKLFPTENEK